MKKTTNLSLFIRAIPSTGGLGWGGVLCWDGVRGCRVCVGGR